MQRETKDGCLMANVEDFESAKNLFESQMESAITKLTEKENKIVKYIANHGACTITDISDGTGFSYGVVRNILKGRKGQVGGGLLEKIEGLTVSQETHTEADDNTRVSKTCEYFSMQNALDNFGGFETFAVLAE
jgi:hypothetical protein